MRGRRERASEEKDGEEGKRAVVRRRREIGSEEVDGVVRRIERKEGER